MILNKWYKSTYSDPQGSCVEILNDTRVVQVRDSKDPTGPVLTFDRPSWDSLINGVRSGEFDL